MALVPAGGDCVLVQGVELYCWNGTNNNWYSIPVFPFQSTGYMYANGASGGTVSTTIPQTAVVAGTLYSAAGTPLPTCASGINGKSLVVSDATSPTYMGAYTSGGAITADVICSYNGTTYAWLTH